jgi:hypothetical protein
MAVDGSRQPASGVGVGSNPTAALALFALLVAIRFVGEQIREVTMSKKLRKSKAKVRASKRNEKLTLIVAYSFETMWAVGVSVVAAIGISNSTRAPLLKC